MTHGWVDHPILLLIAGVLSAPLVWVVAKAFFRNIAEDVQETSYPLLDAMSLYFSESWLFVKVLYFLVVCIMLIAMFYRIGTWFLP
jgi:uncharacterized protein YybS (DUF2232 family)